MQQMTLASVNFEQHRKVTPRAAFLAKMDRVVPWQELCSIIEPVYPKAGNGRPSTDLERMLRLHSSSTGSICSTRQPRKRSMTLIRCGSSSASTWAAGD
jgi:hypothetical protein